jgi:hypothetical protein
METLRPPAAGSAEDDRIDPGITLALFVQRARDYDATVVRPTDHHVENAAL